MHVSGSHPHAQPAPVQHERCRLAAPTLRGAPPPLQPPDLPLEAAPLHPVRLAPGPAGSGPGRQHPAGEQAEAGGTENAASSAVEQQPPRPQAKNLYSSLPRSIPP